jgi:hypothetical protein
MRDEDEATCGALLLRRATLFCRDAGKGALALVAGEVRRACSREMVETAEGGQEAGKPAKKEARKGRVSLSSSVTMAVVAVVVVVNPRALRAARGGRGARPRDAGLSRARRKRAARFLATGRTAGAVGRACFRGSSAAILSPTPPALLLATPVASSSSSRSGVASYFCASARA